MIGAGDAFLAGFLCGYPRWYDWCRCVRFRRAIGAILVVRRACANDMTYSPEALDFVTMRGGF